MMYDAKPFVALDQFKDVAFRARIKARQAIIRNTPTTSGAKLLVACTALRACRNGLTATAKQCCESWDPVARCFHSQFVACVSFRALRNMKASPGTKSAHMQKNF